MNPGEIQSLLRRLSLRSESLTRAVTDGFRTLEPSADAVRALRELLTSSDRDRREAAAEGLRQSGRRGVEALLEAARKESDPRGRASAVEALGDSGGQGCSVTGARYSTLGVNPVPTLWECLSDSHADVRAAAVEGLAELDARNPELIERAAAMTRDDDPRVRSKAARLLGGERERSTSQTKAVAMLLDDRDPGVRFEAAFVLTGLGVEHDLVGSILFTGLDYPDERIRALSAHRLRHFPSRAAELAPALAAKLYDPDPQVARAVLETLSGFGREAEAAVPAIDALFRRKEFVADCAAALGRIGPAGLSALAARLGDPDEEIRYQVVCAVGHRGPEARVAMGGLLRCLDDAVARVRFRAAQAVLRVDPAQATTVILLIRQSSEFDRSHLAWYLAEVGEPAAEVFRRLAADPDPALRTLAEQGRARLAERVQ